MAVRICCLGSDRSDAVKDVPPVGLRPRAVRGMIGVVFLGLAAWVPFWPLRAKRYAGRP